jgi:Probable cobalt transporter subunit (CbtA)
LAAACWQVRSAAGAPFVFARIFVEPVIGRAVAFKDACMQAAHEQGVHEHGAELFSRAVQANIGMGFGVLAFGVAIGALLAVALASMASATHSIEAVAAQRHSALSTGAMKRTHCRQPSTPTCPTRKLTPLALSR